MNELTSSFNAGLIYKNYVLQALLQLNCAGINVIKVKNGLTLAKLSPAQIIGLGDSASNLVNDFVTGSLHEANQGLYDAINSRPEISLLSKFIQKLFPCYLHFCHSTPGLLFGFLPCNTCHGRFRQAHALGI